MSAPDWISALRRESVIVGLLIAFEFAMAAAFLVNDRLLDSDSLTEFIDLGEEQSLPTWFSSIQWFCTAVLMWAFVERNVRWANRRSWLLLAIPLVFLALSLDEVAGIHEAIGGRSDALLPGGDRDNIVFDQTGIWFVLLGVPFVVGLALGYVAVRPWLTGTRDGLIRLVAGMIVFLIGAIGIEILSNFVVEDSFADAVQVSVEELVEMIGATLVLWGAYRYARGAGWSWGGEPPAGPPSIDPITTPD